MPQQSQPNIEQLLIEIPFIFNYFQTQKYLKTVIWLDTIWQYALKIYGCCACRSCRDSDLKSIIKWEKGFESSTLFLSLPASHIFDMHTRNVMNAINWFSARVWVVFFFSFAGTLTVKLFRFDWNVKCIEDENFERIRWCDLIQLITM